LPLALAPPVTMSSRYSAREAPAADKAPIRGEKTARPITREDLGLEASETTLRHLFQRAGTPSKVGDGRLTEEQIFKGLVVDYLSHERFPNTVGVLLGARTTNIENGKGKARESEGQEDDDVYMMSASTTLGRPEGHAEKNGKLDPEAFVKQIERRKGEYTSTRNTGADPVIEIREMLISGRITAATDLVRRHFPSLLDTSRDEYVNLDDGEDDDDMEDDEDEPVSTEWRKPTASTNGKNGTTDVSPVTSRAHVRTTHVSGNAARGGAGSRFGVMTRPGNGTIKTEPTEDVRWTAHPRSTNKPTFNVPDAPELTVPDFPYAHAYDRPTLLALNLDIQDFVESLRVLQQQVPSSPSEAASLSNSMIDESTRDPQPDIGMTSRPATPNPTAAAATRKAARDAATLACLAHASRLDNAARRLRPREARRYAQQVQDVCGLLAYTDMEASPLAGYLEQERRQRLADIVEGCILGELTRQRSWPFADPRSASLGYPPQSILESLWQQDAYLWHPEYGHMAINDIKLDDGDGQYKRMKELAMVSLSARVGSCADVAAGLAVL
jgi:hypothetical protein